MSADENATQNKPSAYEEPDEERPTTAAPTVPALERELPTIQKLDRSPAPPGHDPYAALRLPTYRLFAVTFALAVIGSQSMSVAVQWELFQQTHKSITLGNLGLIQALPVILLALLAGHVSDVFSRKRVLMVTQVLLVIFPLILAFMVKYKHDWRYYIQASYAIILLNACALTFARPARSALLPGLVPKEIFTNAATWNATFFELASVAGPAIGGLIIAKINVFAALVLSAICTSVCFALTALLPDPHVTRKSEPLNMGTLVAGVRFVWRTKILLAIMTLDLFAVLLGGAVYLLPAFAEQMNVGASGFGWLRAAPSIGAITMAMLIAHLPPMKRAGRALLLAVIGFGAATVVFGFSKSFWLSLAMLFFTGAFDNISVVVRHTLVQLLTPDAMRGRVSAVNQVFIGASNELGGMESGYVAQAFSPVFSVVAGGIGAMIVTVLVAFKWPEIRRFGSLQSAQAIEESEPAQGFSVS
ncbi:MAG TPA: MFS transporter [Tepidisphaeraceae bacterium]|jgi:MFS family permease|nr:MFS transporter [Tepidisphaeraceae bacterium]